MAGTQLYTRKVMNKSGYVLEFPGVASMGEFYNGEASLNPYAQSLTQEFPLGTKLTNGERVWRYTRNGAGTPAAGDCLQGAAILHIDAQDDLLCSVAVAGAYEVELTGTANTACAANYYKEGYLVINDAAGQGHSYKIKSHVACTGAATFKIQLYDPLIVGLTAATSEAGLCKNPFDAVIATAAALSAIPIGVSPIALTAAYYFWAQTGGPCAVHAHAAAGIGVAAIVGTHAAAVDPNVDNASTLQIIGWFMTPGIADTEHCLVFLTIDR